MLVASTSVVGFGFRSGVIAAVLPGRARLLVLVRWRARGRVRQARLPLSGACEHGGLQFAQRLADLVERLPGLRQFPSKSSATIGMVRVAK
jgi:hypothetical protein